MRCLNAVLALCGLLRGRGVPRLAGLSFTTPGAYAQAFAAAFAFISRFYLRLCLVRSCFLKDDSAIKKQAVYFEVNGLFKNAGCGGRI